VKVIEALVPQMERNSGIGEVGEVLAPGSAPEKEEYMVIANSVYG